MTQGGGFDNNGHMMGNDGHKPWQWWWQPLQARWQTTVGSRTTWWQHHSVAGDWL